MSTGTRAYTVAVGMGRGRGSTRALTWGMTEAAAHDGTVVAIRAWRPATPTASGSRPPLQTYDAPADLAEEREQLEADVADAVGPSDRVRCQVVHGGPYRALLAASSDADLLVLGAPRRMRSGGLGVAHRLLYVASCPVVVLPPDLQVAPEAR